MFTASLLREARLRAGLTQTQLARRVGTSQSVIARWETGGSRPSLEKLVRVVRACGLELRIGIAEADPDVGSLIDRNLTLSPAERLDQLARTVDFIRAGREALTLARG